MNNSCKTMDRLKTVLKEVDSKENRYREIVALMKNLKGLAKKNFKRTMRINKGYVVTEKDYAGVSHAAGFGLYDGDGDTIFWFTEWHLLFGLLPWRNSDIIDIQIKKDLSLKIKIYNKNIAEAFIKEIKKHIEGKISADWYFNFKTALD